MKCVTSLKIHVVWNGSPLDAFKPTRGIRQVAPLSPYLFVLSTERLGQAITVEIENGNWNLLYLKQRCPHISHLFFADYLILFCEAHIGQVEILIKY